MRDGPGCLQGKFLRIDADGKYRATRFAVTRRHHAVFDRQAEIRSKVSEEIIAIIVGLESDQIVGQHGLDQFAMMRNAAYDRPRRPWRMHEDADPRPHSSIAHFGSEPAQ